MFAAGLRGWRCHPRGIPGRPDIAFTRRRLAVFVDGAFWHGHPDYYRGQSGPFWDKKIAKNRERDSRVDTDLEDAGWRVLRIWDFEVDRDVEACVGRVVDALQ